MSEGRTFDEVNYQFKLTGILTTDPEKYAEITIQLHPLFSTRHKAMIDFRKAEDGSPLKYESGKIIDWCNTKIKEAFYIF